MTDEIADEDSKVSIGGFTETWLRFYSEEFCIFRLWLYTLRTNRIVLIYLFIFKQYIN